MLSLSVLIHSQSWNLLSQNCSNQNVWSNLTKPVLLLTQHAPASFIRGNGNHDYGPTLHYHCTGAHSTAACYCVLIYLSSQLGNNVHGKIDQVRQRIKFLWAKSHCTVSILMRIMGNDANEIDDGFFKSKKQKRVTWLPCRNHSSPNLLVGGLDSPRGYTWGPNHFKPFIKKRSLLKHYKTLKHWFNYYCILRTFLISQTISSEFDL